MENNMTVGSLVAIISYVPLMISTINGLLSINVGKAAISQLLKDIDDIINAPQEKCNSKKIDLINNKPIFKFKNVEFSYDRGEFSLMIKSLKINKGDFWLIVGKSGGGKTSIIDIINKFYEIKSGDIKYYGEDYSDLSPDIVREGISTVLQDAYIFNKSIKENIIYPNTSSNGIDDVLEKAQLVDFINNLPEKELTVINDFGGNFSGGECQRICLARALYKNSDILLFDEPTAALDAVTSRKIFNMLKNESIKNNKTVIVITHDISKIAYADNVAVVSNGSIVECGEPDELLKSNGQLTTLYNSQQSNRKTNY